MNWLLANHKWFINGESLGILIGISKYGLYNNTGYNTNNSGYIWLYDGIYDHTAWWFFATPLKNDGVKVSWDDEIPN